VKHPFRWIALAVGVGVAVLAVVLALSIGNEPRQDALTSRLLGRRSPEFAVTMLKDGKHLTSADLAGKTVIVNFWNGWCLPCQQELPALTSWYARHKDDPDLAFIGIPRDDTAGAIRSAAKEQGVVWSAQQDDGAKAATLAFGTRGQPETYAISPDGVIVGSLYGPVTTQILDQMLARARGTS